VLRVPLSECSGAEDGNKGGRANQFQHERSPIEGVSLLGVLTAPSIHEHKRREERFVPHRRTTPSVFAQKCDEAGT
jgi:hypothetical protein